MGGILADTGSERARACRLGFDGCAASARPSEGTHVTIALEGPAPRPFAAASSTGWLGIAGVASLGAGAVHASAIGVHAAHRPAAVAFAVLALLQLGFG